jgi:hypothetical protein
LPLLDAMMPTAARAGQAALTRMAILYVANGIHMPEWTPGPSATGVELRRVTEPLAPFKHDILLLTGLAQENAEALGDGPGDHARALGAFLTGVHPVKTPGAHIHAGVSVDQVAAARLATLTRLPSLEVGIERGAQSGSCDSGYSCAYSSSLSWRTPTLPSGKEVNPALVFDRLFGAKSGPKYNRQRQSLLDFVREDVDGLVPRVGPRDRQKLDEYLTGVRELEERIARFGQLPPVHPPRFGRPEATPPDLQ